MYLRKSKIKVEHRVGGREGPAGGSRRRGRQEGPRREIRGAGKDLLLCKVEAFLKLLRKRGTLGGKSSQTTTERIQREK